MATTARATQDEKEFIDEPKILDQKVTKLSELLLKSKHCVVFTGAGISTSAGIKDFRSGVDTNVKTGAGVWAIEAAQIKGINIAETEKDIDTTSMLSAIPSLSHMAIVELMNKEMVKFCISQNVDGLHVRSGVPRNKIAELHGNTTLEICEKCNSVYHRDFDVIRPNLHETGRICSIKSCNGKLMDTIVNFGENLAEKDLTAAQNNTDTGDLCIAMGSSLTVRPACDLAAHFGDKTNDKNLVIINLQKTPLDDIASVRIFSKIDEAIDLLCKKIKMSIPQWKLHRYVRVTIDSENGTLNIDALYENWTVPSSIFKSVVFKVGNTMKFKGDSKWLDSVKKTYTETMKKQSGLSAEDMKARELKELTAALKKCDKSLKRYAKMIYDSGYQSIDSLKEFRMDQAVDIMQGSNNYERRKLVETFSKPLITDSDLLIDETVSFAFEVTDLALGSEESKEDIGTETENYVEFEFNKNYGEPNLKLDLNKYLKSGQNEHKLNMTYDLAKKEWTVVV